jgi:hypothetical protein
VAQNRADLALDLMWRFMDLAEPVLNRVDDSNGSVGDVSVRSRSRPGPIR